MGLLKSVKELSQKMRFPNKLNGRIIMIIEVMGRTAGWIALLWGDKINLLYLNAIGL